MQTSHQVVTFRKRYAIVTHTFPVTHLSRTSMAVKLQERIRNSGKVPSVCELMKCHQVI